MSIELNGYVAVPILSSSDNVPRFFMKKIIQILLLAILTVSAYSQNPKVRKYKAVKYLLVFFDDNDDFVTMTKMRDTSILVVINSPESNIIFYGKTDRKYNITKEAVKTVDGTFNYYKFTNCIDPEGKRCNIRIGVSNTEDDLEGLMFLYLDYKGLTYYYIIRPE